MDILVGLLIVIAMVWVLARPFSQRSSEDERIYRRLSGLDGEEFVHRIACPHCGKAILPDAATCPSCRKDVSHPAG